MNLDGYIAYISVIVNPTEPVRFMGGLVVMTEPFAPEEAELVAF